MKKIIRLTQEGFDEKKAELAALQKNRVEAISELQSARAMGDLSENAAYKVARSKLSRIDGRIRFLNKIMRDVVVTQKRSDGRIGIGSIVEIEQNGEKKEITIVDGYESDFIRGKISSFSPIGRAMMGRMKDEKIEVITPNGAVRYMILSVK